MEPNQPLTEKFEQYFSGCRHFDAGAVDAKRPFWREKCNSGPDFEGQIKKAAKIASAGNYSRLSGWKDKKMEENFHPEGFLRLCLTGVEVLGVGPVL